MTTKLVTLQFKLGDEQLLEPGDKIVNSKLDLNYWIVLVQRQLD